MPTEDSTATSTISAMSPMLSKGLAEHAEEERDLQNAGEAGAIHVHGGAQRNHDLG